MITRRHLLSIAGASAVYPLSVGPILSANSQRSQPDPARSKLIQTWMDTWMEGDRRLGAPLKVSRFRDPMYFLISPISWEADLARADKYKSVEVPTGFVTDFASIPNLLFSILRPDGNYAYAAVIHDFLYWTQERSRAEADDIFRLAMHDLQVSNVTIATIHQAVRTFGGSAWNGNARLKENNEKRILAKYPDSPTVDWADWKKQAGVFAPEGRR